MATGPGMSLTETLGNYLAQLNSDGQRDGQQELNRFVQWCGRERSVNQLTPTEIADYAEWAGMWGGDSAGRMRPIKSYLTYLKATGLVKVNLATHLKVPKTKKGSHRAYVKAPGEHAELSPEGYANLSSRLEILKEERSRVILDIQKAMADKDFKENSPLEAAKERQGLIESGIRDLERILASAVVAGSPGTSLEQRVRIGRKVTLKDVTTGKEICYTLVDPREADPVSGKISSASPVGKALMARSVGEEVRITVPRGTLHYTLEKIES